MAVGGNPGLASGTNNSAITLVDPLGQCGTLTPAGFCVINEVTTVATAYALAGFLNSNEAISSTRTNVTGLQNTFATVNKSCGCALRNRISSCSALDNVQISVCIDRYTGYGAELPIG